VRQRDAQGVASQIRIDQKINYHPQSGGFEDTPLKGSADNGYPLKGGNRNLP